MKIVQNRYLFIGLSALLLVAASYMKCYLGLGSYYYALSAVSILAPVLCFMHGGLESILVLVFYAAAHTLLKGGLFIPFMTTFGLPTLCATFALRSSNSPLSFQNAFFKLIVPACAIALFALHPQGIGAMPYACYWFIPMAVYCYERFFSPTLFSTALAASFVAHSVGSVIYLYRFSLSSSQWISLIPVVAIERLAIALGIAASISLYALASKKNKALFSLFVVKQ